MDKRKDKIIDHIKEYIKQIEVNDISLDIVYLFGSYASGKQKEWSDIDVALVSKLFTGDLIDDKNKIRKITLKYNYLISPVTFNTSDFNDDNPFTREIINTGIRII
jgi:predicted nucleotidyltransferase